MKKLLFIFTFLLCAIISFCQSGFPNNQTISNNATLYHAKGGLMGDSGLVNVSFPDTATANLGPYIKNTNSIQIRVHDTIFIRDLPTYTWVKFSTNANVNPNGCISGKQFGDVVWDSLLVFHSTLMDYYIGCRHFTAAPTDFTLAPAFPSNPRVDVWVVDTFGVIRVVTGSISGLAYQPNPASELQVAQATIAAGATVPSGISNLSVYKENVHPPEWTGASVVSGVLFNYAINPFLGDSSTYIPSFVNGDIVNYQDLINIYDVNDFSFLKFYVRLGAVMNSGNMNVTFYNGAVQATSTITIQNGQYGFNSTLVGTYQLIAIPFSDFLKIYPFQVNLVQFQFTGTGGSLQFDNIVLQAGGQGVGTSGVIDITGNSGSTRSGHYVIQKPDIGWFYDSTSLNSDSTYDYHWNNSTFLDSSYRPYDIIFAGTNMVIRDTAVGPRRGHIFDAGGGSFLGTSVNFIVSDSLSTPPVLPPEGSIFLVGTAPTGQFSGHANEIATRDSVLAIYSFQIPVAGNLLYNAETGFVSQLISGTWVRIGRPLLHQRGDDYGGTIVGSRDNFKTSVITNNIERMVITNAGNVGIGISPTAGQMLEVLGNILSNNDITSYGFTNTASAFRGPQIFSGTSNPFYLRGNNSPIIVTNTAIAYTSPLSFFTAKSDVLSSARGTIPYPTMYGQDKTAIEAVNAQRDFGIGIYNKTNKYLFISDSVQFRRIIMEDANSNVAIGDTVLGPTTAQLWVPSTTKGVLFAPMTAVQRLAISSPANGLMVYDTDSACYFSYTGSAWQSMCGGTGGGGGSETWQQTLINGSQFSQDNTVDLNGNKLIFVDSDGNEMLNIDPVAHQTSSFIGDGTAHAELFITANTGVAVNFSMYANDDSHNAVEILGNAVTSDILYGADTHTFQGTIVYNLPPSGAPTDSVLTWNASTNIVNRRSVSSLVGNTIYTGDDAITGNRTVDLAGNDLHFEDVGGTNLSINTGDGEIRFLTPLAKQIQVSDANDQVLVQYDNDRQFIMNGTGTSLTGIDNDTISLRVIHASGAESLLKIGDDGSPPRVTLGLQDIPNGQTAEYLFQAGGAALSINSITADQRLVSYNINSGGIQTSYSSSTTSSSSTLLHGINTGDHPYIDISAQGNTSGQTGQVFVTDTSININTPLLRINGNIYSAGGGGGNSVTGQEFTGSTSTTLTLSQNYISGSIKLFKNGVRLLIADFTEATANTITLNVARLTGDVFQTDFNY